MSDHFWKKPGERSLRNGRTQMLVTLLVILSFQRNDHFWIYGHSCLTWTLTILKSLISSYLQNAGLILKRPMKKSGQTEMLNTRSFWGSEWSNHLVWSFWSHSKYHIWIHLFQVSLRMRDRFLKWLSSNGNTEISRFRSSVRGMFGHNRSNPRVSQSPTGYMLRFFRIYLLLWSTFYRFLGNDPSSSQSLELQLVISETRVVHLWLS
jgi:hypothetical protein